MELVVKQNVRPCTVRFDGETTVNALFHGFFVYQGVRSAIFMGGVSGQEANAMAIVELEGGQMSIVQAHRVKFLDSENLFNEFSWEECAHGDWGDRQ